MRPFLLIFSLFLGVSGLGVLTQPVGGHRSGRLRSIGISAAYLTRTSYLLTETDETNNQIVYGPIP
jgi:hypothetical protein